MSDRMKVGDAVKALEVAAIKQDFPILTQQNRGKPVIYLDTAASAQKPQAVIDATSIFYGHDYANIHRGIYELSERATALYEGAREQVRQFINAAHADEIVFVRGTTEAINLVAQVDGRARFETDDEVILTTMEHHSNIVPWYLLKEQIGIKLKVAPILPTGEVDMAAFKRLFTARTKMVAVAHASNAMGTINPVREMAAIAHAHGVPILLDGAQAVPHMPVDVQALDCDFYAFSGHKLYGPTGIGVLYGKRKWLEAMLPYQGGGGMIETVSFDMITFAKSPQRFEAGTPDIAGAVGLSAAIRYVAQIGMDSIFSKEQALLDYAEARLNDIDGLRIIGTARPKVGVISFVMDGIHPHDIGTVLDHEGIAVRAGHHCAMPLMHFFDVPATVRASFGIYNDQSDVDALVESILLAKRLFA